MKGESMTIKEYLSRPKELKEEIRCDLDNLAAMRSIVENCTTHLSFTAGRNPSKNKDAFERTMIRITEAEEKIEEKKDRLTALQVEVLDKISLLEDKNQKAVLRARFIEGLSWRKIEETVHITKRHAIRLQQQGLKELEKLSP